MKLSSWKVSAFQLDCPQMYLPIPVRPRVEEAVSWRDVTGLGAPVRWMWGYVIPTRYLSLSLCPGCFFILGVSLYVRHTMAKLSKN